MFRNLFGSSPKSPTIEGALAAFVQQAIPGQQDSAIRCTQLMLEAANKVYAANAAYSETEDAFRTLKQVLQTYGPALNSPIIFAFGTVPWNIDYYPPVVGRLVAWSTERYGFSTLHGLEASSLRNNWSLLAEGFAHSISKGYPNWGGYGRPYTVDSLREMTLGFWTYMLYMSVYAILTFMHTRYPFMTEKWYKESWNCREEIRPDTTSDNRRVVSRMRDAFSLEKSTYERFYGTNLAQCVEKLDFWLQMY